MSIKSTTTAPVSSTTLSEADQIKIAWRTNPSDDLFFYILYGFQYAFTLVPSFFGSYLIFWSRQISYYYLLIDALGKINIVSAKKNDNDPIWNFTNLWLIAIRRYLVEFFLMFLHPVTQLIPGVNWVFNLIPMAISYVNVFVL